MSPNNLIVGLSCSQTGRYRERANPVHRSLQLWCDRCNARGGLPREGDQRPVKLIVRDDGSQQEAARNHYRDLIQEGVDLLFGPYGSDLNRAALDVAREHDRLLWNHGGASDDLQRKGARHLISVLAPCSTYFGELPRFTSNQNFQSLTLVRSERGSFASRVAQGLRQAARSVDVSTHEIPYNPGKEEFNPLEHAGAVNAEVLVLVSSFQEEIDMIRSLSTSEYNPRMVACVAAGVRAFGGFLGPVAEGIVGTCQWHPDASGDPDRGPTSEEFRKLYEQEWLQTPDYPAAQAYACGLVAEEILSRTDSWNPGDFRKTSRTARFSTFFGPFDVDPGTGRQVGKRPELVQWQDGDPGLVTPSDY